MLNIRVRIQWPPFVRLVAVLLFLYGNTPWIYAQGTFAGSSGSVMVHVLDSATKSPMPGVRVMVWNGRDSSSWVTENNGVVQYNRALRTDSLKISASHLGYQTKTVSLRVPADRAMPAIFIPLAEVPEELVEIVVVGKSLAVVVKGDTVQFNASAFKVFANESMEKLFEALPGMSFDNGQLTYMGESIHRITIDGKRLFGDHVDLALANIRADDVEDVRVYQELSDDDKFLNNSHSKRVTVADVRTKSKMEFIQNITAQAAIGTTIGPKSKRFPFKDLQSMASEFEQVTNQVTKRPNLYDLSGGLVLSRTGRTISSELSHGNISSNQINPKYFAGGITASFDELDNFKFSTSNSVNLGKNVQLSANAEDYLRPDGMPSLSYLTRAVGNRRSQQVDTKNEYQKYFVDQSILGIRLDGRYQMSNTNRVEHTAALEDQVILNQTKLSNSNEENPSYLFGGIGYHKKINRARLNVGLDMRENRTTTHGHQYDTLGPRADALYLKRDGTNLNRLGALRTTLSFALTELTHISVTNQSSYTKSREAQMSVDQLTGRNDPNYTYDFLTHDFTNQVSGNFTFNDNQKGYGWTQFQTSLNWSYTNLLRDESLPQRLEIPKAFHTIVGSLGANYKLGTFSGIKINYRRIPHTVSLLNYIPFDPTNPLTLRAGNPDLRIPVSNQLRSELSLIRGSATYLFKLNFSLSENEHLEKTQYFHEATYLPEYDYLAVTGSRLITFEHKRWANRSVSIGGDYSILSQALHSKISTSLSGIVNQLPAFINGNEEVLNGKHLNASLKIEGNFSSYFMPSIGWALRHSNRRTPQLQSTWTTHELNLDFDALLQGSWEFRMQNAWKWNLHKPNGSQLDNFGMIANCTLSYLFDNRGDYALKLQGFDLFNRNPRIGTRTGLESIRTNYSYQLGRHFLLGVNLKF